MVGNERTKERTIIKKKRGSGRVYFLEPISGTAGGKSLRNDVLLDRYTLRLAPGFLISYLFRSVSWYPASGKWTLRFIPQSFPQRFSDQVSIKVEPRSLLRVFLIHVRDPQFYALPAKTRAKNGNIRVMGFPPIGIMSLSSVLKRAGHECVMFDQANPDTPNDVIIDEIKRQKPVLV